MRRPESLICVASLVLIAAAQLLDAGANERAQRKIEPLESVLMGHQSVVVDYFWFDLLQYYGGYSLGEHDLSEFVQRYERLSAAAPRFHGATLFAAVIRADNMEDPEGALRWLERAEGSNPEFWLYPYEQGFVNYLWLQDYPAAIAAFKRAGLRKSVPSSWRHFVARISELGGDPQVAREMWLQIADTAEHPRVHDSAMRNVERLDTILQVRGRDGAGGEL